MSDIEQHSIAGGWIGTYFYRGLSFGSPVRFEATFREMDGGRFAGTILDDGAGGEAHAAGTRSQQEVLFEKTYLKPRPGFTFSMSYRGTLSEDGRTLHGTWRGGINARGVWEARRLWVEGQADHTREENGRRGGDDDAVTLAALYGLTLAEGLAGGFSHCIGMCGVFVVSYSGVASAEDRRRLHPERHALFHAGRLLSLGTLGLLGGEIGALGHRFGVLQGAIGLLVGVALIGLALGVSGLVPRLRLPEPDVLGAGGGAGRRLFLRALQSRSALRPLLIGLFVGLLPCGLTYNALIATFTLSPHSGALLMLCFGLGTVPGLLTLGLFGNALFGGALTDLRFRKAMTQVAALFMAVLGVAFVWRGLGGL